MKNVFGISLALVVATFGMAAAVVFGVSGNSSFDTAAAHEGNQGHACDQKMSIEARTDANGGKFFIVGPIEQISADSITVAMPLGTFDISLAGHEDLANQFQPGDVVKIKGSIDETGAFTLESVHQRCVGQEDNDEEATETATAAGATDVATESPIESASAAETEEPTDPATTAAAEEEDADEPEDDADEDDAGDVDDDEHDAENGNTGNLHVPVNIDFHQNTDFHSGNDHGDNHDKERNNHDHDKQEHDGDDD